MRPIVVSDAGALTRLRTSRVDGVRAPWGSAEVKVAMDAANFGSARGPLARPKIRSERLLQSASQHP